MMRVSSLHRVMPEYGILASLFDEIAGALPDTARIAGHGAVWHHCAPYKRRIDGEAPVLLERPVSANYFSRRRQPFRLHGNPVSRCVLPEEFRHDRHALQPEDHATADRLFADRRGDQGQDRADRGQVAHDAAGKLVGENDFGAQVEQVFKNLDAAVRAAGGTFKDIVKINNYCVASVDPAQLATFREVRDRYVDTKAPPTSTFVFVSRLVRPGWLFETDAMAVIGS